MTLPPFRLRRRQRAAVELPDRLGRETLQFPLPVPERLALVNTGFHVAANMKSFAADDLAGLTHYAPDALALPLPAALSLANQQLRGQADLRSLKFAMVVLTSPDSQGIETHRLSSQHRNLLWKAFGVPLFEQLLGWDGRVIARECEVHNGLHFHGDGLQVAVDGRYVTMMGVPTGIAAEIVRERCECSAETPRLQYLVTPVGTGMARAAAA